MKKLFTLALALALGISAIPAVAMQRVNVANLDRRLRAIEGQEVPAGKAQTWMEWARNNKIKTAAGISLAAAILYMGVYEIPDTQMCDIVLGPRRGMDFFARAGLNDHCERMIKSCWSVFGSRFCFIR